jgi:all-trans-8'-apo-beta-carotenal 15,15'-oxygenase
MVSMAAPAYTTADWQLGYRSLPVEHSYWIDEIDGQIPSDLQGTLFRNGPGLLDIGGQAYGHPFDGDGMIVSIRFGQGRAHFSNRFVKTPEFLAEQQAGKILYRGVFGTQKPGGWWQNFLDLRFKNPVNTNVIYHGGKLLALWEASTPYRLDPATLETLGSETFNGVLKTNQPFTAHPRIDPETGDLIGFGVRSGLNSTLYFYRVNSQGQLVEKKEHQIPGFAFLHDSVWTPRYRVFFQNPMSFNSLPFVLGLQPAGACLELDPQAPTRIWVFDQEGALQTLETDPGFIFHFVNGYEQGDQLVIDLILYDDYLQLEPNSDYRQINFDTVPAGKLYRLTLNLAQKTIQHQLLLDRAVEFPAIHPDTVGRSHRFIYIGTTHTPTGNAPLQAILKLDTLTGKETIISFAPRGFIGEPVFVPRPGSTLEDDGWVITLIFNAATQRSEVIILNAEDLGAGPLARLGLKHHVPYGLHGMFASELA